MNEKTQSQPLPAEAPKMVVPMVLDGSHFDVATVALLLHVEQLDENGQAMFREAAYRGYGRIPVRNGPDEFFVAPVDIVVSGFGVFLPKMQTVSLLQLSQPRFVAAGEPIPHPVRAKPVEEAAAAANEGEVPT